MKRALKIIGITLGSLVAIVVIVALIAVYIVFTPKRITPIVNRVADSLLVCQHELESVELTVFSTFPNVGVRIKGLYIINPMEGAPSDTVLAVPDLVVSADVKKALKGDIYIHDFQLHEAQANVYIAADGATNIDILRLPADTIEQVEDTTSSTWQLRSIGWEGSLTVDATQLSFLDRKDSIDALLRNVSLALTDRPQDNRAVLLELASQHTFLTYGQEQYANDIRLTLTLPVEVREELELHINGMKLSINQFDLLLDGSVAIEQSCGWTDNTYTLDVTARTNDWRISEVLALLPPSITELIPKEIEADGVVCLSAHATGVYDSISLPVVDAEVQLKDTQGQYTELPYYFDALQADVTAHVDLNNKPATRATVKNLYAHTGNSSVTAQGQATEILSAGKDIALGNPLCDLTAQVDLDCKEADYWIRSDAMTNQVQGRIQGTVSAQTRLNDVLDQNLHRITAQADLSLTDIDVIWQDSMLAQSPAMDVHLTLPKKNVTNKKLVSAEAAVKIKQTHAQMLSMNMDAFITGGSLHGDVEWDMKAKQAIPIVTAGFDLEDLVATMDTIYVHAVAPKGSISQRTHQTDTKPFVRAALEALNLQAHVGQALSVTTDNFRINAGALYNKEAENILLKWNPRLDIDLHNGHTDLAVVGTPIDIPQMKFQYDNHIFHIDTSRIVLGNSDFSLGGEIHNVGKWLREEETLTGELRFTSDKTDVNELMAIINHVTGADQAEQDDTTAQTPTSDIAEDVSTTDNAAEASSIEASDGPFMVPERVDLALLTRIKKAYFADETLENLGGKLYVKDGKLILEEMGFICEAAKMQLTAIYQTPRRNHLYAGLDFHLIDIDIQQLIRMIPEIDSLVPMLQSFRGGAQFHIALETYMTENYQPKQSTMRGACSIEGKNLVLMDSETFTKISKILLFNKKTENLIDSISAQLALYKNQITVYPFCLSIDNYMVALGGNHYTNMNFDYHASLLKPLYIGVDVKGNLDDLSIKPAKCRYAQDFRPIIHKDVESQSAELRRIIAESLKKSVKIQ